MVCAPRGLVWLGQTFHVRSTKVGFGALSWEAEIKKTYLQSVPKTNVRIYTLPQGPSQNCKPIKLGPTTTKQHQRRPKTKEKLLPGPPMLVVFFGGFWLKATKKQPTLVVLATKQPLLALRRSADAQPMSSTAREVPATAVMRPKTTRKLQSSEVTSKRSDCRGGFLIVRILR